MSPLISEKKESPPVLIVDKIGSIGHDLSLKLSNESTVVFVTQKEANVENVLYVPFERKIPKVPENIYSHIFIIDDGEDITFDFLSSFLKKADDDKAIFCFCTSILNQDTIPQEVVEYKKTRIVFLGDIFPAKNIFSKSYVNRFIVSSKNKGRISIPGEGMTVSHPVFWDDAILGILEASFGTSKEKIYYDFPKHGATLLSLAHTLQKIYPEIKIDFSSEEEPAQISLNKEGKYLLSDNYPIEEKIKKQKISVGKFSKTAGVEDNVKKDLNISVISVKSTRLVIFSLFLFLFLPLITTLLFTFIAFSALDFGRSLKETKSLLTLSRISFELAQSFSKVLNYETGLFQISPFIKISDSIEKNRRQIESAFDYYDSLDLLGSGETAEGISLLKNFIIFGELKNLIIIDSKLQNFISQTIDVWSQIFGIGSKRTYLILFQNNLTPRATGGLIESFGLINFSDGKFTDFKIYDTNDSDKNLKGHVEPPFAIRRYLPSANLFMKDSNFSPDFLETAASSAFFANLEEGMKVDGVVAVNWSFIQQLAKKLDTNIDSLSMKNSAAELFKRLQKENSFKVFMSADFIDLIQKKDIIFQFSDQSLENTFLSNNFSSSLLDNRQDSQNKINDFVSVIETDLGLPVANIERKLTDKINVSENGEVSSSLIIEYKNGEDNDYKNYLRFITPNGALLNKIRIDGTDTDFTDAIKDTSIYEAKDFTPPQKLEVEKYSNQGKSFFGFLINIPKRQRKTIEIDYRFDSISLSDSNFTYNLKVFKQPGISSYPFDFSLSYPDYFKTSQKTSLSKFIDEDFNLNLNFSKK